MVFEYNEYNELKGAVLNDFKRFSEWGFNAKQIYPATLEEYQYGGYYKTRIYVSICLLY